MAMNRSTLNCAKNPALASRSTIVGAAFWNLATQIVLSSKSCQAPGSIQFPATTSFHYKKKAPNHVMFYPWNLSYWYQRVNCVELTSARSKMCILRGYLGFSSNQFHRFRRKTHFSGYIPVANWKTHTQDPNNCGTARPDYGTGGPAFRVLCEGGAVTARRFAQSKFSGLSGNQPLSMLN
jgi:hypothetical protein